MTDTVMLHKDNIATATTKGVDGAVGVARIKWYAAIVSPRHEKTVAAKLADQGIDSYVATQKEMHLWRNGKRRRIDRVVITSIVFVRCTERQRRQIVTLPYILRFVVNRSVDTDGLNKPPATIPDAEMHRLKFMLGHADSPVEFVPTTFSVDDNVRVIRGNLRGLEGSVVVDSDGTHSLTIRIPLLGCAKVTIDPTDIEKI